MVVESPQKKNIRRVLRMPCSMLWNSRSATPLPMTVKSP